MNIKTAQKTRDVGQWQGRWTRPMAFVLCLMSFALTAGAEAHAGPNVVINEVQSSNDQTLLDDREESPDWVELWNGGEAPVDISGWILTDKPNKPEKWWKFPQETVIDPGEHLVVYADSTGLEDEVGPVDPLEPDADELKDALVAWYDADQLSGSAPSSWTDRSGNGFLATGSGTLVTDAVNGHKAVRFTASSRQCFTVPTTQSGFTDRLANLAEVTVIVVGNWSGTLDNGYAGLFGVTHGKSSDNTCMQLGSGGTLRMQYSNNDKLKSSAVMAKDTWAVAAFTTQKAGLESAQTKLYFNGECVVEGTPSTTSYSSTFGKSSSKMYFGAAPYGGSTVSYFDGLIAEVIIYNRALTSEECRAVFKSLNERYDLTGDAKPAHHTSFSIGASGETLTLMSADGGYTNSVTFGKIPCDTSYGRVGDGAETWAWFADPTPRSANVAQPYDSPLDPVVFSRERGVFTGSEMVTVELTHPDPDATIYYTTDRSEPSVTNGVIHGNVYKGPITFSETTVIRATAVKEGHLPYRNVTTHSYIWLDQVADQTKPNDTYPATWKDTGSTIASYGISSLIVKDEETRRQFVDALQAAPIVSVTLSDEALFSAENGLYIHPNSMEEREPVQADVEWVTGDDVFGLGVGLEMHGAYSRRFDTTPKKSFKLKFSGAFGGSLDHNVLAPGGGTAVEYKKLILRAENNHSWTSMEADTYSTPGGGHPELGQSMVDQFFRNTQKLTSGFQAEGTHVHLFLNGLYWGLYNLTDQVGDGFAASTWCTDLDPDERLDMRKNFDVIKNDTSTGYAIRDGSATDYNWIKSNVGSTFASAANYAAMTNKFDIVAYIDYLLVEWYLANEDWPGNNWVMAGSSKLGIPARFVLWDSDKSVREENKNLVTQSDGSGAMAFHNSMKNGTGNAEYKLMFADRIRKHLFESGGALTTESVVSRYFALAEKVETFVFAESARWGAYIYENWDSGLGQKPQTTKFDSPFDMTWWRNERDRLTGTWFPNRHATLVSQLRSAGFWSDAFANVSTITANDERQATLSVPSGATVYYTTDGSDPREMFSDNAVGTAYAGQPIDLPEEGGTLKVRAKTTAGWSALTEMAFGPAIETRNVFVQSGKDATWTLDTSWSLGYYPNAAGAIAVIGAPTAGDVSGKGQRKVTIGNGDGVTVGQVELTNGDYINRIESVVKAKSGWAGGDLHFCGAIGPGKDKDTGADILVTNDASIAVLDADGGIGLAVISLDEPWVVRLDADLDVFVTNTVASGGLRIEGALAGDGHNIAKWGPGRLTLAATNVTGDVLGNIQCNEGIVAVEAPLHITSVTKEDTIWLKAGGTDIAAAFETALVCDDKLNKTKVGLFVPTTWGSDTESFYGGAFCAGKLSPGEVTIYVLDDAGEITFCGQRWTAHPEASCTTKGSLTAGDVEYKTFKITVPYFGPKVAVAATVASGKGAVDGTGDVIPGTDVTLTAVPAAGYSFKAWTTGGVAVVENPLVLSAVAEDTAVAVAFTANVYSVVYAPNGGTGEMADGTATYDADYTVAACGFEKTGYAFDCWATPVPEAATVRAGEVVSNLTTEGSVTLAAQWTANDYTVTYAAGAGEGEAFVSNCTYDVAFAAAECPFAKTGHAFAGWADGEGAVVTRAGEVVSNLTAVAGGNVTLTATWAPNAYTLVYAPGGGSGEPVPVNLVYNQAHTVMENPFTYDGYMFVGWQGPVAEDNRTVAVSATDAGRFSPGDVISNLTATAGATVTFTALWEELPPDPVKPPEEVKEVGLKVGETLVITNSSFHNWRYWLVGGDRKFKHIRAELNIETKPFTKKQGYQLRSTEKAKGVIVTVTGVEPGEETLHVGRQYKITEPDYAVEYKIKVVK